jgi:superfamily II DNA or RNA helicase
VLVPGNLVRWVNGPTGDIGMVTEASNGRVKVRFDSGDEHQFAVAAGMLEPVIYEPGAQVEFTADRTVGVVKARVIHDGVNVYKVSTPSGMKTALEASLKPAVLSDPIALLRAGQVHSARSTNLRLTATRLAYAHQFDELSSLSNSRVEIKPHQVAVLHRVASNYPHRFLLADEVGLGKTIEAGLIIKELKARGMANRVLVLAPSGIVSQWQFELRTKFSEIFSLYRRDTISFLQSKHPGENVWTIEDNVLASTSYVVADEQRMRDIALAGWDLIVIDEAHHARRQMQSETKRTWTRLWTLAEMLADPSSAGTQALLLLTATPMQLHPFELYSLIELIDPTLFPDYFEFEEHRSQLAGLNATVDAVKRWPTLDTREQADFLDSVVQWLERDAVTVQQELDDPEQRSAITQELLSKHRLSEVMVRNRKAVVGGFQPRTAVVWPVEMTQAEWVAYEAIGHYVRSGYARAQAIKNNALGFLMSTFQKLGSSSSYALRQSLLRRIERLEAGLAGPKSTPAIEESDLEEKPAAEALADVLGARYQDAVAEEIRELAELVALLDGIALDSKALVLQQRLREIAEEEANPKVLLFTQSRDTQDYLSERIPEPWSVNIFHGQLKPDDKDAAVGRFRTGDGPQILLSTEAGGEGRNFQFCHILINYDLPWNPMRIEQRIGRLDRIGQKHPVTIINFSLTGTIEERVLEVVSNRIQVFKETIGGLDPILGEVEQDLKKVFLASRAEGEAALARLDKQLEIRVQAAREAERRMADLIMDTKSFRQDEVHALLERKGAIDNNAVRLFVINALVELGCKIEEDPEMAAVYDIKFRGQFLNEFPHFVKEGLVRRVTFSPSVALDYETIDFLAFGHELVDALVARVRATEYRGHTSHRVIGTDEQEPTSGWFFAYSLELEGVVRSKEIFPVFIHANGAQDPDLAQWLLDRAGRGKREEFGEPQVPELDETFDRSAASADVLALSRLLERQEQLADANRERLEQERRKLERYYEYRTRTAAAKLESTQRVLDKVSASDDPGEQRIVPVWMKNLENAKRVMENLASEREQRLSQLVGREQVTAQHELLAVSYVEIVSETASA